MSEEFSQGVLSNATSSSRVSSRSGGSSSRGGGADYQQQQQQQYLQQPYQQQYHHQQQQHHEPIYEDEAAVDVDGEDDPYHDEPIHSSVHSHSHHSRQSHQSHSHSHSQSHSQSYGGAGGGRGVDVDQDLGGDDDDDVDDDDDDDDDIRYEQRFAEYAAHHASAQFSMDDSHGSLLESVDRNDPNYLFGILQDALPKAADSGADGGAAAKHQQAAATSSGSERQQQQRRDQTELVWERVRRWLWANPHASQRQAAADVRGVADATCLHLVCKLHNPPEDVVHALLEAAGSADNALPQWTDSHGWLPLHHACANGASPEVLKLVVDAFPDGRLQQDRQGRTPLHFYATRHHDSPANMALNAELLAEDGAAALQDRSGMLPFHYACAYGTHVAVLKALARVHPDSLRARDDNGRTPMHLAMVNAHRDESPSVIRFLLENGASRDTINTRDRDGYLPLHLLALALKDKKKTKKMDADKKNSVSECLSMYLAAEPFAAADFLTAIQDLPDFLQDTAVVSKHVRNILNEKIVKRFPTSILMLDGIFLVVLIVCFGLTTRNHIDLRYDHNSTSGENDSSTDNTTKGALVMVFVGAFYFLTRELVQFASLMSLGSLSSWWTDPANYLDMAVITLTFYYGILMHISADDYDNDGGGATGISRSLQQDGIDGDGIDDSNGSMRNATFRAGAALTQGILWVAIIVYLKSTLVDFAVFVGGVFYVVQRLVAFLIAVGVILLAFAQMFYFVYLDTSICEPNQTGDPDFDDCDFPHCSFEGSLLKVYTMMMGEIGDETRYSTNLTAQILYVGYGFLVVILLSNVLIAIVTDSYEIIQNDRAAIVFWSNRLDFIAEMDAITYAIQRRVLGKKFDRDKGKAKALALTSGRDASEEYGGDEHHQPGLPPSMDPQQEAALDGGTTNTSPDGFDFEESNEFFREAWHQVMLLFDANLYDDIDWIETWVYNIFRIFSIFIIIPLWIALGACTAGWLWPPQVREWLFVQKETAISRAELERQKLGQLKSIQTDLKLLKQEIMREMASDRDEMIRMKAEVETVQGEVYADLQQVKELMDSLLSV